MDKRIQIDTLEPEAFKAMYVLEHYLQQSQLSATHIALIKIRASQINKCAFCINMHTRDAIKSGETVQRIFLLNGWRESSLYTKEEMLILEITEEVTLIHQKGLSKKTYQKAIEAFDKNYLAQIIMAITTINAWNRIAISTHKPLDD